MKKISFDDFDAWVATQSDFLKKGAVFDEAVDFEEEGVQFHEGDYVADDIMVAPVTVIEGNLTAARITQEFELGLLVVKGDLNVDYIDPMNMSIVVGGNLNARFVVADSSNDYYLFVGGDVVCDFFVETGCYVEVGGKISCPIVWNTANTVIAHGGVEGKLIVGPPGAEKRRVGVDEVVSLNGYVDRDKVVQLLLNGKSPYRS